MPSILPFPSRPQVQARVICPKCGQIPAQRLDTQVGRETIASAICKAGHLFVTQWRAE